MPHVVGHFLERSGFVLNLSGVGQTGTEIVIQFPDGSRATLLAFRLGDGANLPRKGTFTQTGKDAERRCIQSVAIERDLASQLLDSALHGGALFCECESIIG